MSDIIALTVTKRPHRLVETARMLIAQTVRPMTWLVCTHGFGEDEDAANEAYDLTKEAFELTSGGGITFFIKHHGKAERLADIRNSGMESAAASGCDIVATFDDDDYYGPLYFQSLLESMERHPGGAVYGIREYWIGWVPEKEGLAFDGSNLYGKWMSRGGDIVKGDRVTWVVDATIAMRTETWLKNPTLRYGLKPLREDGSEPGGECEAIMQACKDLDLPVISREPDTFVVARVDSDGGWGGEHGHTWGPLEPRHEPEPEPEPERPVWQAEELANIVVAEMARRLSAQPQAAVPRGELMVFVRRRKAGEKVLPKFLWPIIQEDETLAPGMVQFRLVQGSDHHVLKTVVLAIGGEGP